MIVGTIKSIAKNSQIANFISFSFIWSTVFSLYIFSYRCIWLGWNFYGYIGLIFAVYYTFKQFHKAEKSSVSVFKSKNYDPSKIMVIIFVILFMFVFSKGVEVLTKTNSYSVPYDGPAKSAFEKWLPFTKGD